MAVQGVAEVRLAISLSDYVKRTTTVKGLEACSCGNGHSDTYINPNPSEDWQSNGWWR